MARGRNRVSLAKSVCGYDLEVGIPNLIELLEDEDRDAAERARWALEDLLGYGFGGKSDSDQYYSHDERAKHARMWWRLEKGRPLKVLKEEALFP